MSFNDLLDRNHEYNLKVAESFLNGSIESQNLFDLRSNILNTDIKEKYFKEVFEEASVFKELDVNFFKKTKQLLNTQIKEILILQGLIQERVAEYSAEISVKKLNLNSKINELRKKINILKNKTSADSAYKYILLEEFINAFNINTAKNNESVLNIDTVAEVATLPISKEDEIKVDKIYISNKSNCIPGSYATGENKFIYNLLDNNQETSFECFKEGSGPLTLDIVLTFKNKSIINKLEIVQQAVDANGRATLNDVKYRTLGGETISLKTLVGELQELKVSAKNENLTIYHLPIEATSISMSLSVNEYSKISNLDIYSLGIKKISFYKVEYSKAGEIYSQTFNTAEGYYFLNIKDSVFPQSNLMNNITKSISVNNGVDYSNIEDEMLLDGRSKEIIYNYKVSKSIENLRFKTISLDKGYFADVESESFIINKDYSPNTRILNNENRDNLSIKVYQNKLIERSTDKNKAVLLKQVNATGKQEIQLPINVGHISSDEINIYCNGVLWEQVNTEELVTLEGKYFVKNNNSIVVSISRVNSSLIFTMLLKPKIPEIRKEQEGFYLNIDEVFDFDKRSIKLTTIASKSEEYVKNIASGVEVYFFEESYIDPNSFSLEIYENGSWVESSGFTLEVKEAILRFNEDLVPLEKRITYKHFIVTEIEGDKYEIWSKDGKIQGLYLNEENLFLEEIQDDLSENNTELYYLYDGTYSAARESANSNKTFVLSSPNIVKGSIRVSDNLFQDDFKEVSYIDGISEHLNIRIMSQDFAPRIEKNSLGQVSFSLLHTPYTSGAFSQTVKVFKNSQLVPENRYSVSGKIVTLSLESNEQISDGYYVSYAYSLESFDFKSFSIDYKNGIFYTSEEVAVPSLVKVTYKVGRLGVEYNLCKEIRDYTFVENTGELKIYPDKFSSINNNVKVFFFKEKNTLSLKNLESYYSPIIYNLRIGLN